ncbi:MULTISPECIES: DMT family transporter [unclassified Fusobacterium]|uniref:DMT family transporter n=1 Tax=unclassified Fusobacterium TaxID=2648384 RepID=UPI00260FFCD7|nr:DMT family transporter [Fusobacterium sp.]
MNIKEKQNQLSAIIYILFMGFGYPLIRYISTIFHTVNTNALMFLSGGTLFVLVSFFKFRDELIKLKNNLWLLPRLFLLASLTAGNMYCFVGGLSKTSALAGSIFGILSMPFSIIMAAIFFLDEREKVKELHFILGGLLALAGSFIFVLTGAHKSSSSSDFLLGITLLAGTIVIQTLQSFVVKGTAKHIHSMVISSCSSILTSIIFFTISIMTGNIHELLTASGDNITKVLLTGMYSIFVGMVMTFFIIQKQGVVVLNVLKLTLPPVTAIIGYLLLNENITLYQGIGASFVLLGCIVALRRKK